MTRRALSSIGSECPTRTVGPGIGSRRDRLPSPPGPAACGTQAGIHTDLRRLCRQPVTFPGVLSDSFVAAAARGRYHRSIMIAGAVPVHGTVAGSSIKFAPPGGELKKGMESGGETPAAGAAIIIGLAVTVPVTVTQSVPDRL